jgi:general secretion pathway protein C
MLSLIQKHLTLFHLLLIGLVGIAAGHLGATVLGVYLRPPALQLQAPRPETRAAARATLGDYSAILQRNIFDSASPGLQLPATEAAMAEQTETAGTSAPPADLLLFGTVTANENSLALIRVNKEIQIFHLGDQLPGGARVKEILRNLVRLENPDGTTSDLPLYEGEETGSTPGSGPTVTRSEGAATAGIRSVGENRFQISRQEIDKARGNLNELLKQARMEPNIVDGRTEGFVVRMIQPRSLLANLGIQLGDVVNEVNGVTLDGPEKALQIFQQLREANNITIGLTRGGTRMNYEYEVN